MSPSRPPVIVVGAGIVGTACACALRRDGHTVVLVEQSAPAAGCSAGNAGVIACESILPLASPALLRKLPGMLLDRRGPVSLPLAQLPALAPWLGRFLWAARPAQVERAGTTLAALMGRALPAYRRLLDWAGLDGRLREDGWLYAYRRRRSFLADAGERALQRARGIDWRLLEPAEWGALAPALSRAVAAVVWYPGSAWCADPAGLVRELAMRFTAAGGQLRRGCLQGLEPGAGGTLRARLEDGELSGSALVLALGADSAPLCSRLEGHPVPLVGERGYHLDFPETRLELSRPVMFAEHKVVATPLGGGLRLAGTAEFAAAEAPPDWARAERLAAAVGDLLPGLPDPQRAERWMGRRPTLPDSLPVISRSERHPNLFYAFGHQHLGLTLAAVTGELIADLVAARPPPLDLRPLAVQRFAAR